MPGWGCSTGSHGYGWGGSIKIAGSAAFVTGANRGLGRRFAEQLVARGATVYGGVRNVASLDVPGVIPVEIDVTDAASVASAAAEASGVSLLINNAGSYTGASVRRLP